VVRIFDRKRQSNVNESVRTGQDKLGKNRCWRSSGRSTVRLLVVETRPMRMGCR
jgi:hypothetical protein